MRSNNANSYLGSIWGQSKNCRLLSTQYFYSDPKYRNKHTEDSSNIRAWSVKNGWHPKAANELEKLWVKIYNLKNTPKVKDSIQAKRSYEHWVKKSKENANK